MERVGSGKRAEGIKINRLETRMRIRGLIPVDWLWHLNRNPRMCVYIYIYMQYNHRGSFSIREFRVYAICRITRTWEKRGFFFDRITRIAQRLNQIYFLFLAILFFNAVRIFIIYTRLRRLNTGKLLDDQKNVKEKLSRMIVKIVDIFLLFLAYEEENIWHLDNRVTLKSKQVTIQQAVEFRWGIFIWNWWLALEFCPIIYLLGWTSEKSWIN